VENKSDPVNSPALEGAAFLLLLVGITLAFGWILLPFYGAVFWSIVLAILFAPLNRRLRQALNDRRTLAALITLAIVLVIVILPLALLSTALVKEASDVIARIQSGELNFVRYFEQILARLPDWVERLLDRFGIGDLGALQERLSASAAKGASPFARSAAQFAAGLGQDAMNFVVSLFIAVYLAFFLIRDGSLLARRMKTAIPLDGQYKRDLFAKFAAVVRATVKGNVVVAIVQGLLGGLAFWFLGLKGVLVWGTVMAFLSLLPAIGAGLVWFPVAAYLLATGREWEGMGLIAYGVLVIGLVDNLLRPILVGKDTKMPDYVVLISTVGGIAVFGLNGFVIGPLIAALFIAVWDIFSTARAEREE
jgi:predicted PurR-regulated permease PerM